MGHLAHMKNQFLSINTSAKSYDHIVYERDNTLSLIIFVKYWMVLIVKTNSHVTQGCFVPSLAEMGPCSGSGDKGCRPTFLKTYLNPKDALWQVWLKLVQWFWKNAAVVFKSLKQVVTPLSNARQQVLVSQVLGDDHNKGLARVTVGVAR